MRTFRKSSHKRGVFGYFGIWGAFLGLYNRLAITLTAGVMLKEEKSPLLWARDSLRGILGDNLGKGKWESKIVSRQWGDNFCRETSRCLAGLREFGLKSWKFRQIREVLGLIG